MANRARCRVCNDVIESSNEDWVFCSCKKVAIRGQGENFKAAAKDQNDFVHIDKEGREVDPISANTNCPLTATDDPPVQNKNQLMVLVEDMIENIERLPQSAKNMALTHYDMMSLLLLFKRFLEFE